MPIYVGKKRGKVTADTQGVLNGCHLIYLWHNSTTVICENAWACVADVNLIRYM